MGAKSIIRYVTVYRNHCGLTTEPLRSIRARVGSDNLSQYRNATQADVDHVRAMGGHVPDGRIVRSRSKAGTPS